jgi:hypothetical protein
MVSIRIDVMPDVAACGHLRFMLGSGDDDKAAQAWRVGTFQVVGNPIPELVRFIYKWVGDQEGDDIHIYNERDLKTKFLDYLSEEGKDGQKEVLQRKRQDRGSEKLKTDTRFFRRAFLKLLLVTCKDARGSVAFRRQLRPAVVAHYFLGEEGVISAKDAAERFWARFCLGDGWDEEAFKIVGYLRELEAMGPCEKIQVCDTVARPKNLPDERHRQRSDTNGVTQVANELDFTRLLGKGQGGGVFAARWGGEEGFAAKLQTSSGGREELCKKLANTVKEMKILHFLKEQVALAHREVSICFPVGCGEYACLVLPMCELVTIWMRVQLTAFYSLK